MISSHASTKIEGNPLPLTEVKRILKSQPQIIDFSQREVLNYNQALLTLKEKEKESWSLTSKMIFDIHKKVMAGLLPRFQLGRTRKQAIVINDPRTGKVLFLPPDPVDVCQLVDELVEFVNADEKIDPVILAGLFHKQFVIVHPFMDGNGRTARLMTKVLLAKMGLDTFNLFSFENYYNQHLTEYFSRVGVFGDYYNLVKKIDFTAWLEYFAEGIFQELLRVKKDLSLAILTPKTEVQSYHEKILSFIKDKGYIAHRDYARLTNRARSTRNTDFKKLIKMGLIVKKAKGKATFYQLKQ